MLQGRPPRTLRLGPEGRGVVLLWRPRPVVVCVVVLAVAVVAGVVTITAGRLGIPLAELPDVLAGNGSRIQEWALFTTRLPRLAVAALAGAAFAVSGALFQSVTRNPLGSPDVIGLGAGAAAGAAAAGLVWPGTMPVPAGAVVGAVVAVVAVWLGTGRGFSAPHRMVVAGIAVGAMAISFVQLALAKAAREEAQEVAIWINGSLVARTWSDAALIGVAVLLLLPAALALTRPLQLVEMGDEAATAVGVRPGRVRTVAVVVGVLATAAAVAVCGPIAFVALTAPQIARRLTRSTGPGVVAAACTGAAVLVVADLLAQHAIPGQQFPVGVVTAALGGVYLAFLLVREWRRSAA
ncbi:FecCD family ABC transporter permease [Cellulomonas biazotea]|uniref:ABC transporter permease n=1 Tax=Cellulomonas biazotea TaxID=1709 RepID=A0A402DSY9_9CELL|nr:iron chelate uptake ABC transporter family permease subunit [Cellulomonas biazotea]GCE77186.1 ABC transporter permease [Cellulomonas biazotea]